MTSTSAEEFQFHIVSDFLLLLHLWGRIKNEGWISRRREEGRKEGGGERPQNKTNQGRSGTLEDGRLVSAAHRRSNFVMRLRPGARSLRKTRGDVQERCRLVTGEARRTRRHPEPLSLLQERHEV